MLQVTPTTEGRGKSLASGVSRRHLHHKNPTLLCCYYATTISLKRTVLSFKCFSLKVQLKLIEGSTKTNKCLKRYGAGCFKITARIDWFGALSAALAQNSEHARVVSSELLCSLKSPITRDFGFALHSVGIVVLYESLWFGPKHYLVSPRVDK